MARQTRSQRRARRAQATPGDGAAIQRGRATQPTARRAPAPAATVERRIPGSGAKRFVSESWAELKKVEWPGQSQLIQGVVVVLVACIVVGVFLYGNDLIWKRFVQNVLLR
jgi:preprotein translocase SecE subunit